MRAVGCLGFGALAFMMLMFSLVFWPLIVVAFAFFVAAIVMLCLPSQRPSPPQVIVQPVPMWWDGHRWRHYR